uniref:Uncharacterized protein n=1 Tax=Pseudictyota dubia TaxID=2749911 RepID=A0A7R9WHZ7_9STRA|eukprot:CAMPEP_0197433962 /NCGR_PEP_ID=MMETSP1175-20131217/1759_1 /TAXON_ID=1003142 /ORGANISM="Triceratium dubium, Strain CCMP147" /LENGTH=262 /DNA_ID=CAMNT_0042962513 /DNA_START=76 /DNA_END=864 /DNA_ORIENTATION=-
MLATRPLLKAAEKASGTAARAISAKEAPSVTPAKESTTETMMPWNGWFSSFLKDKIGAERYDKLRRSVLYMPDDIHDLNQVPNPSTKVPLTEDGKETAQFRYPSPGSAEPVKVPINDKGTRYEDPFVTSHFTQDTARRHRDPAFPNPEAEKLRLELLPQDDPRVIEAKEKFAEGPKSSPGNKGMFATGKSDFDPEGLRATMSANHEALNKSLDANLPNHLPTPEWWDRQDEIIAWHEERGLPVPLGAPGHITIPREGRIARW